MQFEFIIFPQDGQPETVEHHQLNSDASALAKAGRLAKKHGCPVDLARAGGALWADRYMTTASPSEFHASGYRFKRLDG